MKDDGDWQKPKPNWFERMAVVAACAAGLFVFKDDLWRLLGETREKVRTEVRENMPVSSEIARARELASALVPDLRRNHEVIVREQVEIDELRSDIEASQQRIKRQREQLVTLRGELKSACDREPDAETKSVAIDLRRELQHRFLTLQSDMATAESKAQTLKYREESLSKAMTVQNDMRRKKRELEAKVAELEARVKLLESEGVERHIVVDRDHLVRCEEQLRYLKKRLSIAEGISKFSDGEPGVADRNENELADDSVEAEVDQFLKREKG